MCVSLSGKSEVMQTGSFPLLQVFWFASREVTNCLLWKVNTATLLKIEVFAFSNILNELFHSMCVKIFMLLFCFLS